MTHRSLVSMLVVVALLAGACGDEPSELARVGPDSRSEVFEAPGPWHVEATADGYCAVVVFAEPGDERLTGGWGLETFQVSVEGAGRFVIQTSGCVSATAVSD